MTANACLDNYPGLSFSQADLYILRHQLDYLRDSYKAYRTGMYRHFEMFQGASPYGDKVNLESLGPLYSEDYEKVLTFQELKNDPSAAALIREGKERVNLGEIGEKAQSATVDKLIDEFLKRTDWSRASFILMPLEKFQQNARFLATATLDGLNGMMDNFYTGAAALYLFQAWEDSWGDELYDPAFALPDQADQSARVIGDLDAVIAMIGSVSYSKTNEENRVVWTALKEALNGQNTNLADLDLKASVTRTRLGYGWIQQWVYSALRTAGMNPTTPAADVNGDGVTELLGDAILLGWKMEIDSLRGAIDIHRELISEYTSPEMELLLFVDPNPDSEIDRYPVSAHVDLPLYRPALPESPDWTVGLSGCDFTTIQAAVDAAAPGDSILVHSKGSGVYYQESVTIDKEGIILYGTPENRPFIGKPDGASPLPFAVAITADNVQVLNLVIQRAGRGIIVEGNSAVVANNHVQWVIYGLLLKECHNSLFAGNLVADAVSRAIRVERGSGNAVYYNSFHLQSDVTRIACAYSSGSNTWDDGANTGNFWSDYDGTGSYAIADGREKDDRVYGARTVTPCQTLKLKALVSGVMGGDALAVDFYFGDPDNGGILLNPTPISAQIQGNYAVSLYEWNTAGFLGTQNIHARIHGSSRGVFEKLRIFPNGNWSNEGNYYVAGLHLEGNEAVTLFGNLTWVNSPYEAAGITVPGGAVLSLSGAIFSQETELEISVAEGGSFFSAADVVWNAAIDFFYGVERLLDRFTPVANKTAFDISPGNLQLSGCGSVDWRDRDFNGVNLRLSGIDELFIDGLTAGALTIADSIFAVAAPGKATNSVIGTLTVRDCDSLQILKNAFSDTSGGIILENTVCNVEIIDNTFADIADYAIRGAVAAIELVVSSNRFERCSGALSLSLQTGARDIDFFDNVLSGLTSPGHAGIRLNAGSLLSDAGVTVAHNDFINDSPQDVDAVVFVNLDGGLVEDNTFRYLDHGLNLQGCEHITVTGNRFLNGSAGCDNASSGVNSWYFGTTGNYWSGFACSGPDPENPRVCATAFTNAEGVEDPHPLINETYLAGLISVPATGAQGAWDENGESVWDDAVQDGAIRAGVEWPEPRFERLDDDNLLFLDRLTGLVWYGYGNIIGDFYPSFDIYGTAGDGRVPWQQALDFIAAVNDGTCSAVSGGFSDWRLPTINELLSLKQARDDSTAGFLSQCNDFQYIEAAEYWSSTTHDLYTGSAWVMDFGYAGYTTYRTKTEVAYPLMVRAGASGYSDTAYPANVPVTGQTVSYATGDGADLQRGVAWSADNRFVDHGDGTATDTLTGLMWWTEPLQPVGVTWQEGLDALVFLNQSGGIPGGGSDNRGYSDWRMPNVKELLSLVSYGNCADAYSIPIGHPFSNLLTPVWTSTTPPIYPDKAYQVRFDSGEMSATAKTTDTLRVLPVRGGNVRRPGDPEIWMDPSDGIAFGGVHRLKSAANPITVGNSGDSPALLYMVYLTGRDADSFYFRVEPYPNRPIDSGGSRSFDVVFRPASPGEKEAWAVVYSDDPTAPRKALRLTGTGVTHTLAITVQGNGCGSVEAYASYGRETHIIGDSGSLQVVPDTQVCLTAIPSTGSYFAGWTGTSCTSGNPCWERIERDTDVTATFTLNSYTITGAAHGGGALSPSGSVAVNHGDDRVYTFNADPDYYLSDVQVDGVSIGAPETYTFEDIDADHTITANFELIKHTISVSAGAGGAVSPFGDVGMDVTQEKTFTVTPDPGYVVSDLLIDGVSQGALSSYILSCPEENHTIVAIFEKIEYSVSITHSGYGAINPAGPLTMTATDSLTLTFTPDAHWYVEDVVVNGQSKGAVNAYEITGVIEDLTIHVVFETKWRRLEATSTEGGSIWPEGEMYVEPDGSRRFIITPDDGYRIRDVKVDGVSQGAIGRYTFTHVDASHVIEALFVPHNPLPISLPRTGADISWYEGDDGDQQKGIGWPNPRFTDNGDGTITDNLTGLIWLKDSAALGAHNWQDALDVIGILNANPQSLAPIDYDGDYPDWRMPNRFELISLFANAGEASSVAWLESQGFKGIQGTWSSTTTPEMGAPGEETAFFIQAGAGGFTHAYVGKANNIGGVLAVRSASIGPFVVPRTGQKISYSPGDDGDLQKGAAWPSPRFIDNSDGTLTDRLTNLMWLKTADPLSDYDGYSYGVPWDYAKTLIEDINSGDSPVCDPRYDQWHIPNAWELLSLFDASRESPVFPADHLFIHTSENGTIDDDYYWTSTVNPENNEQLGIAWTESRTAINRHNIYEWNHAASRAVAWAVRDAAFTNVLAVVTENGAISPSGNIRIEVGETQTFTITPDTGFRIADVLVDGESKGPMDSYDFNNITKPHTLEARFEPIIYTVTITITGNGAVYPSYDQPDYPVDGGDCPRFDFIPGNENRVGNVLVDGISVGSPSYYRFQPIAEDHVLHVAFESIVGEKAEIPATGQKVFYAAGDDGDHQSGVSWPEPRFVDNGDGTITDMLTGLMWLKHASLGTLERGWQHTWNNALEEVAAFNTDPVSFQREEYTANYTDWRLPNIVELSSILRNAGVPDVKTWLESAGFLQVPDSSTAFWSSTTLTLGPTTYAYCAYYDSIDHSAMSNPFWTWPVRGTASGKIYLPSTGQTASYAVGDDGDSKKGLSWPDPRFIDHGDGTVTDKLTGLMWLKNADLASGAVNWPSALDAVAGINDGSIPGACGYADWRLPTISEQMSLIDWSDASPAVADGHPFSNLKTYYPYWSSTTAAHSTGEAYVADFSYARISPAAKADRYDADNYVMAVRKPYYTISYSPSTSTNQNVFAAITFSDDAMTVTSEGGAAHIFTENGTWDFTFEDGESAPVTVTATVDWIDKSPPAADIAYSTTNPTNQDVVATLSISDGTITSTGGATHTFTGNGDWTFTFEDGLGNAGTAAATVDWIDKAPPTATIEAPPDSISDQTQLTLFVGGDEVVSFKYRLDDDAYGDETVISIPISLSDLSEGIHAIFVIGRDAAGNWQLEDNATSVSWEILINYPGDLNNDNQINLKDAVLAAQVLCKIEHQQTVYLQADVNDDGMIGLEELIYALQKEAGLRE